MVVILLSVLLSTAKFATWNPVASAYGVITVTVTETEYTQIQKEPQKVLVAKARSETKTAEGLLDQYMEAQGYTKTQRMGSLITYCKGDRAETVDFSVNRYYSLWKWVPKGD